MQALTAVLRGNGDRYLIGHESGGFGFQINSLQLVGPSTAIRPASCAADHTNHDGVRFHQCD